jgi:hypothetical protein
MDNVVLKIVSQNPIETIFVSRRTDLSRATHGPLYRDLTDAVQRFLARLLVDRTDGVNINCDMSAFAGGFD